MEEVNQVHQVLSNHDLRFLDFIGSGSYSTVFLCRSLKYDNNYFAVKQILKKNITKNEIDALISLVHPYIVKLYKTFSKDNFYYLVMEHCSKGTIKSLHKLDYNQFSYYGKQLLEVVDYIHSQNIAHRDIKPENLFLDQYNHIKLGDFGFAYKFQNNKLSHEVCGSLMYCAPEIFSDSEFDPFKCDIWSLGITFFYMATGNYPFHEKSNEKLKEAIKTQKIDFSQYEVDQQIQFLITKMTNKNPSLRPSANELLELPIFNKISIKIAGKNKSNSFINFNSKKNNLLHLTFCKKFCNSTFFDVKNNNNKEENNAENKKSKIRARCFNLNNYFHPNRFVCYQ